VAVNITLTDKVLKVSNQSIVLLGSLIKNKEIEERGMELFVKGILHYDIMNKLIWRAEESNS